MKDKIKNEELSKMTEGYGNNSYEIWVGLWIRKKISGENGEM